MPNGELLAAYQDTSREVGDPIADCLSSAISDLVNQSIATITNGAPAALDTLKELADAIGDDVNFAGTITTGFQTASVSTLPKR